MGEEKKYLERIKESGSPCSPGGATGADQNEDDLVFPGFRFHPTDQELVEFYLTRKVEKKAFSIEIIKEIDIYKHDPWDLPKLSHAQRQGGFGFGSLGEKEWYFFCLRWRKYRNSIRPNRVTGSGFWKATGIDKPIYPSSSSPDAGACIGLKKSLVYYRGSAGKGTKTDWMMHEFRLPSSPSPAESTTTANASSLNTSQDAEIWTICRIFKRSMSYNKRCQQQPKQQQQDQHGNRRSHHYQQLEYYQYHHHRHHFTCSAPPMATGSFELDAGRFHATAHQQPFLLTGFHGASSAAVSTPGMGAPAPPGWSETTSYRVDGSSSWDELGRIMEISTDSSYL